VNGILEADEIAFELTPDEDFGDVAHSWKIIQLPCIYSEPNGSVVESDDGNGNECVSDCW